jgi:hypothetical protein
MMMADDEVTIEETTEETIEETTETPTEYYMDYEDRLMEKIEEVASKYPIFTDVVSEDSSISVATLPASTVVRQYYNGISDKEYIHELTAKAKASERAQATKELAAIGVKLEQLADIPSNNQSYDFGGITVTNELFFSEATTDGWIYFRLQIKTLLTVYEV